MLKRQIELQIKELALDRHKMAFVSGPRQCGKTTMARSLLFSPDLYFNWDQLKFRQLWTKSQTQIAEQALHHHHPRLVLDEIHKNKRWKTELKGFYDEYGDKIDILVTGSARLDTYRRGGDSLFGRFYHFHLHPFSLSEYVQRKVMSFEEFTSLVDSSDLPPSNKDDDATENLFKFGGFPEPLLSGREDIHRLWQTNRLDLLVRHDLRDLSQIVELSQVEILAAMLPLRVGSPLSIQSLREDIEVAFTTVQRWLKLLEVLYYHFKVQPYSRSINRSLKKEGKLYLYDWSTVEDPGPRFENMVASHFLKIFDRWNDSGLARIELYYLRDKEKNEIDFLAVKNKKPWFTAEAKLSNLQLDPKFQIFQRQLKIPHFQITKSANVGRLFKADSGTARVVSFERFFSRLG